MDLPPISMPPPPPATERAARRTIQPTRVVDEAHVDAADASPSSGSSLDRRSHASAAFASGNHRTPSPSPVHASSPPPTSACPAKQALLDSALQRAGAGKRKRVSAASSLGQPELMEERKEAPADDEDAIPAAAAVVPLRRAASRRSTSRPVMLFQRQSSSDGPSAADYASDEDDEDWAEKSEEEEAYGERKSKTKAKPKAKRKSTTKKPAAKQAAAATTAAPVASAAAPAAPAPPAAPAAPVPQVFNPAHLPSAASCAASASIVRARFDTILENTEEVGPTTPSQRSRLPKDLLLQRNLEIQRQLLHMDSSYDELLESKPEKWEQSVRRLDALSDSLAEESDEIETLLFEKFRVRGGGRTLASDEGLEAAQFGASMAHQHRERGLPLPKLSAPVPAPAEPSAAAATAAAAAASSSADASHARALPHTELLPIPEESDAAMAVVKSESECGSSAAASSSSAAAAGDSAVSRSGSGGSTGSSSGAASSSMDVASSAPIPRMSKSDAAMWAKFDAAQDATRIRRAERKAKQAEGLLGRSLEYFDRFVDVDRPDASPTKRNNTPRKAKPLPPSSFPLYLGTIVMPLFTDASVIRAHLEPEKEAASGLANPAASAGASAAASGAASPVPAASPSLSPSVSLSSASSHGRKRRRDSGSSDRHADGLSEDDSSVAGSDDAGGAEEVWLDFLPDPTYIDGCVVKQVRPIRSARDNNATETITLGILPLQGLHPPMPEEPEVQLDAEGQPIPQPPRSKPMPDPSHPLAALYILHEGLNIIRLESSLIRRKPSADSAAAAATSSSSPSGSPTAPSSASFDQVEVSIHVNSRIFHTQLLRSNAQRQALLTLFHLFSPPSDPSAQALGSPAPAIAPRYTNAAGVEVAYADLTDEERYAWARTAHGAGASVDAAVAPVAPVAATPADDGPAAMDLDEGDSPAPFARAATVAASVVSPAVIPAATVAASSAPVATPAAASESAASFSPSKQQLPSGKRQAVSSTPLSLIDQTIAGDDIGESDEEDDAEDEDEEEEGEDNESAEDEDDDADGLESLESDDDEEDSADDLFDEVLVKDHYVFVDLKLPEQDAEDVAAAEPSMTGAPAAVADPAASPISSASAASEIKVKLEPVEEEAELDQQVSAEEAAEYDSLARANARLDTDPTTVGKSAVDEDGVPLDGEEQELEAEQKQKWRPDSLHALFESIRPTPAWTLAAAQPAGLTCTLRPFQQKALAWMMARENPPETAVFEDALWQRVVLNGWPAWYQPFLGVVSREEPPKHKEIRGGVLAEEMGLGKTVEVIALILSKPWISPAESMELIETSPPAPALSPVVKLEEGEEHKSMDDVEGAEASKTASTVPAVRPLTRIGATLIVSPMSIVHQWKKEIMLHAPSLRVMIYSGCRTNLPVAEAAEEYARTMAQFAESDVVLVNYPTLNKEVNYSRECMHALREKKRYAVPQSALLDCHWLRVILDEAQMVHNALSVCFRMAARLTCDARWCVSGTPIGPQGLHDLYGLVSFLGVQPYDAPGIWRHAMRTKEPAGLERLRALLRRIMWRHSKAHVESECSIPALHLRKLYLEFNSVEWEVYEDLRLKARTKVLYSAQKNDLEDRTAFHKLDLLRQVCSHPQANADGYFGKSFKGVNEMEKRWIQITQDELTSSERRLCREINKAALEFIAQGKTEEAELMLKQSWTISDRGFAASGIDGAPAAAAAASSVKSEKPTAEGRHSFKARATHAQTIADEAAAAAAVTVKSAAALKSNLLDNFETDVNIKTANEQILKWRHIDLVITYNLARIYRSKIEAMDGAELPPNDARTLSIGQESCEEVFQRAMREAEAVVLPRAMGDRSWAAMADAVADDAAFELPPQLMGAASAASSSSSSAAAASSASSSSAAIDLSDEPDDLGTDRSSLLRKYHRQCAQYDFSLHELLDLFERRMADAAFLIAHKYEAELLPSWVATSLPDVQTLYAERKRVSVDRFNSGSELYMSRVTGLEELLSARINGMDDVLMLYDLQRWVKQIEELQRLMAENPQVVARKTIWLTELQSNERFLKLQKTCGALAKPKKRAASKKPSKAALKAEAKVRREPRNWREALQNSLSKYRISIRKYEKKLDEATLAEMHADPFYISDLPMDSPLRVVRAKYDAQWHALRDSLGALRTMIEVRDERRKMRIYARKMLDHQCSILREAKIITPEQAALWMRQRVEEVQNMDDSGQQPKQGEEEGAPKKKKPKRASSKEDKSNAAAPPAVAAAAAAASAASASPPAAAVAAAAAPAPASLVPPPSLLDAAQRESVLRDHFQAIKVAKQLCVSRHSKVSRVTSLFGSSVPECRDQECAICKKIITAPILTSCLHWFDHHCFMNWRNTGKNTCPICRDILADDDFVRCKLSALSTQAIKQEETAQAKAAAAAAASSDQLSRRSSSGSSGRKDPDADLSSTVAASGTSSAASAAAALRPLPPTDLATLRSIPLVGEGQCGTKIEMVCKAIKLLKQSDPTVQILVFSQFTRVLEMTHAVLSANAISSLHLEGTPDKRAKMLDLFQSDPSHTVLLLSLRHDNSGLTLVSASAVFLLEPSLNPSVEAQAINRIHRIGQRRETTVVKFLMRGSIEEDIEQMGHAARQGQAVATGADNLLQHGREGMSVKQLLTVFGMADDEDEERIEAIRAYKEEMVD